MSGHTCLERYQLQACLYRCWNRRVFRAYDRVRERTVVLKGVLAAPDSHDVKDLEKEYARLRRYSHPGLVAAYDLDQWGAEVPLGEDGLLEPESLRTFRFFTQALIEGPSLASLCGRLPVDEVRQCLLELTEVVAFLHASGLTRLDLKPAHLLKTPSRWVLIDLDQARLDVPLAERGAFGTVAYIAPEVLSGGDGSFTADVFSMGALLFEVLTGHPPPLPGESWEEISASLRASPVPDLPEAVRDKAPDLAMLCQRLLARAPADRPASALEVLAILGRPESDFRASSPVPPPTYPLEVPAQLLPLLEGQDGRAGGAFAIRGAPQAGRSASLRGLAEAWQTEGLSVLHLEAHDYPSTPCGALGLMKRFLEVASGKPAPAAPKAREAILDRPSGERRDALIRSHLSALLSLGERFRRGCRPAVILLDDPLTMDELSLSVLERLLPLCQESGLVLGITVCEGGESTGVSLSKGLPTVLLPKLALDDARGLAEALLGPGCLTQEELLRLVESKDGLAGAIWDSLSLKWRAPGLPLDACIVEASPKLASSRLEGLSGAAAQLAMECAILEPPMELKVIEALCSDEQRSSLELLEAELVQAHLFIPLPSRPDGERQYRFASERLRRSLEASLSEERRKELYASSAEAMELLAYSTRERGHWLIARQFLATDQRSRAVSHLVDAALEAEQRLCLREMVSSLETLLGLLSERAPGRAQHLFRLGIARYDLGQFALSRSALESALRTPSLSVRESLEARLRLGKALAALGALPEACDLLKATLQSEAIVPFRRATFCGAGWQTYAYVCLRMRSLAEAAFALEEARPFALESDPALLIDQETYDVWRLIEQQELEGVEARLTSALERARSLGFTSREYAALNLMVNICQQKGDLVGARERLDAIVTFARQTFDLPREAVAWANLGRVLQEMEDAPAAVSSFERASSLFERVGNRNAAIRNGLAAVDVLIDAQYIDRAVVAFSRLENPLISEGAEQDGTLGWYELTRARLRLRQRDLEGLEVELEASRQRLLKGRQLELALIAAADLMTLALGRGKPEEAWRISSLVSNFPGSSDYSLRRIHSLAAEAHRRLSLRAGSDRASSDGKLAASREIAAETKASDSTATEIALAFWVERLERIVRASGDETTLAKALATIIGEAFEGRGLMCFFEAIPRPVTKAYCIPEEEVSKIQGLIVERVRREQRTLVIEDTEASPTVRGLRSVREGIVRSVVCCPAIWQGQCLGALYLDHRQAKRIAQSATVRAVERMASLSAELLATLIRREPPIKSSLPRLELLGTSPPFLSMVERLGKILHINEPTTTLLLLGERGTGKSYIAEKFHQASARKQHPLISVSAPDITDTLAGSELYGIESSIATGVKGHEGCFERAGGGILFMDEVGDAGLELQRMLLKVLGQRRYNRIGGKVDRSVDCWLIFATNVNLEQAVKAHKLRLDFLDRIQREKVWVPPLRDRGREDIELLARFAIGQRLETPLDGSRVELRTYLTRRAVRYLSGYHWPGNVRQLLDLFMSADITIRLRAADRLDIVDLEPALRGQVRNPSRTRQDLVRELLHTLPALNKDQLERLDRALKRGFAEELLRGHGGNLQSAAKDAGLSRSTLYDWQQEGREDDEEETPN